MYSELPPIERVNGALIRLSPNQRKRVKALIHRECCNYSDSLCVVLDCECVQSNSYSLCCKWFRRAVLPQDKPLFSEIIDKGQAKRCVICGAALCQSRTEANIAINAPKRCVGRKRRNTSADADREWTFRPLKTTKKRSIETLKTYGVK